jgi:chemosensory pili system protein ChpA (sensor histidine kinase/response regulator)
MFELTNLALDGLEPRTPADQDNANGAALNPAEMASRPMLTAEEVSDAPPLLEPAEEVQLSDAEFAVFEETPPVLATVAHLPAPPSRAESTVPQTAPAVAVAEVIEFPTLQPADTKINDNIKRIGDLEISVPLHNIYLAETDELVRALVRDISEWRHEPDRQVNIQSVHAAHSLAGSSATVGFNALHEVAHALEKVLQFLSRQPVRLLMHEFDTLDQTVERMKLMLQKFALGEMPVYLPEYARLLTSMQQDIEARLDGEGNAFQSYAEPIEFTPVVSASVNDAPVMPTDPVAAEADILPVALPAVGSEDSTEAEPVLKDELDLDLLPVFFEEGRDILPQMGTNLRAWVEEPSNLAMPQSLLRSLHTLKGSARMAGAMALGQHLHDMEARIETLMRLGAPVRIALEDLLVRYDHALQMFEHLQNPDAPASPFGLPAEPAWEADVSASPQPVALTPLVPLHAAEPVEPPVSAIRPVNVPAAPAPLVRVRADILDRLVNQAGEVSISRSKLETEVGALRQSLSELTDNVNRLRDQLREIEMQAETQIASQMAHSADREFDPLEFDRFTRLQELTRMMAESVNDVSSVHHNLNRSLDNAVDDLASQARLTRDLQQDLMRVRMVQFASISERLFRVTRQAAKEMDKRVNLDIRGSAVEIDRGVLEKMTGPFEHLLRNAVVHGIESREARRAAGKPETGELLVEIRQEGNEVVIEFSDDGQGLNVARIRDKAKRIGLLMNDGDMSDEEVTDLIFHPGFSTADDVTELAGRGVGMDVVRSEAAALGGRVAAWSEPGKGAHFRIHLPLTLAVTQVVLLSSGGVTYAVPSVLVEQVQHLKTHALATAYNDGAVVWQGQRVSMYYLPALLGETAGTPTAQQYSPLLILKSGNDRVAIHVDEVIGNREVVVKNIGPQLARLIGIAGATVLGSGNIVLIINPLPLAQRLAQGNLRAPRILPSDAPENMGAVAEFTTSEASTPQSEPVQGLRTQNIVMVVDDSLTVRRVTQRLLTREGYQVVLAKDGVDALEHLQSLTPEVMLVDIEMPRMDGFDLTRNVRSDERTRHIPIIMITSRTATKHRNYALELGVNEYLGKPYREDELLQLIAGYVGKEAPAA